jgi:ABC-type glycerol-3-phosphate transport system substrate-binding protein
MGIFAQSKRRKEAWEFIKFLFRPDTQVKLYEAAQATQETYLPPNMETWDKLPMSPKFKEILKQQVLEAKGPPSVLGWDSSTRFIDEAIQKVVLEAAAPNEALSIAAYEMKKYIGKIGE